MIQVYYNRRDAAKYVRDNYGLRCAEKYLAKLVVTGGGPSYFKDGRAVLYRFDALDAWVSRRVSGPFTSSSNLEMNEARKKRPISGQSGLGLPYVDV